jgi:hypothetical protein
MNSRTHVFLGPSLDRNTAGRLAPDAVLHPPVAHGDLLRLPLEAGDHVVLLDGVFHQSASVRHKEILDVLGQGVTVVGAASMGALRAAELRSFGMIGTGIVYRLYALGVIDADDEVALLHDDDDPNQGAQQHTVAMVSVRVLARRLRIQGRLNRADETQLVGAAANLHFTERSWPALLAGLPAAAAGRILEAVRQPRHTWDVKSRDAMRALAGGGPTARPTLQPWPVTKHLTRWRWHPEGDTSIVLTAAQLWADDYPQLHRRVVLSAIAGLDGSIDEIEATAVEVARRRGLIPAGDLDHLQRRFAHWLDPNERYPSTNRLLSHVLVRSYRWAPNLPALPLLLHAIRGTPGIETLQAMVAEARLFNEHLAARGYLIQHVREPAIFRFCRSRWNTDRLVPVLYDHGFADPADLLHRARPLGPFSALTTIAPITLQAPPRARTESRLA